MFPGEPTLQGGKPMTRIAVIGGGAWGTALADLLVRKGGLESVTLWAREPEVVEHVNRDHLNPVFLPGAGLAPALRASGDVAETVRGADVVVSAAPCHAVRDVMARAAAAKDHRVAQRVQQVFSTSYFRVYSATDVVGVELGGALKNVIALAAGILEGLGLGYNTRAALITRGLAEITRLGVALGAEPATFAGLAGMGDLMLTATGPLSRNHQLGVDLGLGKRLEDALAGRATVAEGVNTARSAVTLGERHGVELPIAREVTAVLFQGKSPRQAVSDLMERELKAEQWR